MDKIYIVMFLVTILFLALGSGAVTEVFTNKRINKRRKLLVRHGYTEIPYGFNDSTPYSYAFQKDDRLITAIELKVMNRYDFKKFLTERK